MIKDEKFRNIFENNITLTKLIKSNAPRFMINMQRHSLISKINKYIELDKFFLKRYKKTIHDNEVAGMVFLRPLLFL